MGFARYGQSPNQAEKHEPKSEGSDQSIDGQNSGEKGVLFLEDDDLDTGEGLPSSISSADK